MADMDLAGAGAQSQDAPVSVLNESSANVEGSTPAEKMLSQSEVEKIVARTREKTREHYYNQGKQDALTERNSSQQQSVPAQSMGGVQQYSPDQIDRMIEDKIKERADQEYGHRIAQDFISKMNAAKDKYPDFEETVAQLNLPSTPHVISWTNSLDNTADVVYEMAKNPSKFAQVLMLSHTSPELARQELSKLSNSIKKNIEASNAPQVNPPLSQLNPSTVGTDNGKMGVRDLRKQPWLKA